MTDTGNDYNDIPGTTVFDAQRSRQGYWLNQFCMSLMKADRRALWPTRCGPPRAPATRGDLRPGDQRVNRPLTVGTPSAGHAL